MTNKYTIGELGKLIGLPTKTIRYYEEINLISPTERGENGYRLYPDSAREELILIKYARDLGLPIATIKRLIKGCTNDSCHHTKHDIEKEIDTYLSLLESKIRQLTQLDTKLKQLRKDIQIPDSCGDAKYCCNILSQLPMVKGGE